MSSITGQGGYVKIGSDILTEIREWKVDITTDIFDTTEFADSAPTFKAKISGLNDWKGSFSGNHGAANPQADIGDAATAYFKVDSATWYTGAIIISSVNPTESVGGEAMISYSFEGNGAVTIETPS